MHSLATLLALGALARTTKAAFLESNGSTEARTIVFLGQADEGECSWSSDGEGFSCRWSEIGEGETSLNLKTDCGVAAPVPRDTYVGDKRTNTGDDGEDEPTGPHIEITATNKGDSADTTTKKSTWVNYVTSPGALEEEVTFSSFGLYDLRLTATDYKGSATCDGCIAIVDDVPPTPKTPCGTLAEETTLDYSTANFEAAQGKESTFTSFYSTDNVNNNYAEDDETTGTNERCDDQTAQQQDFFSSTLTDLTFSDETYDTVCFGTDSFVSDLKEAMTGQLTSNPVNIEMSQDTLDALECKRCCSKSVTLKEYYYDFECGTSVEDTPRPKQGDSECSLGQCLTMPPQSMISSTVSRSGTATTKTATTVSGLPAVPAVTPSDTDIHYSFPCESFDSDDAGCLLNPTLSDMLTTTSTWVSDDSSATTYVFWRYKIDDGDWQAWSDSDTVELSKDSTTVHVEGWSHCGQVASTDFTVYAHLQNPIPDVCASFEAMFTEIKANEDDEDTCAYMDSDFFAVKFEYDSDDDTTTHEEGKVKGHFSELVCSVTVKAQGASGVSAHEWFTQAATIDNEIDVSEEAAFELVQDPNTVAFTEVEISCDFDFAYYDSTVTPDPKTCPVTFTKEDCALPSMTLPNGDPVCSDDACLGSENAALFEACDGTVFSGSATATEMKNTATTCCTECEIELGCNAISDFSSVKRCEMPPDVVLMAAATDATMLNSNSMTTVVLGASAVGAIVALLVARRRAESAAREKAENDVYYPLLE